MHRRRVSLHRDDVWDQLRESLHQHDELWDLWQPLRDEFQLQRGKLHMRFRPDQLRRHVCESERRPFELWRLRDRM